MTYEEQSVHSTAAVQGDVLVDVDGVDLDVISEGGEILFQNFHHGMNLHDELFVVRKLLSHLLL